MDKVTIVIPMYNSEKYIERCLESIKVQTYRQLEILLIDDHSQDQTVARCKSVIKDDERFLLESNIENKGVSYCRNLGIRKATGKYIIFFDSDDYVEKTMIEYLVEMIQKYQADLSICEFFMQKDGLDIRKEPKQISCQCVSSEEMLRDIFSKDQYCGFMWNKLYKLDVIKKYQLNLKEDISICEDLLFNCEYLVRIEKGVYSNKKLYHYLLNRDSCYNRKTYHEKWLSVIKAYEQIEDLFQKQSIQIHDLFYYSYLYALLDLKEKLIGNKKDVNLAIQEKIHELLPIVRKSKKIDGFVKLKTVLKSKYTKLFIRLKEIKNGTAKN